MNGRKEKVCQMTHFLRQPKPRPLLHPSINEKVLIDCISLKTKPPLSRPPDRGPQQQGGRPPAPHPPGPPHSAQTPFCPLSRTSSPARAPAGGAGREQRTGAADLGRCCAGRGRVARQSRTPVSEPTGLRSPYLRGQPVAAQRRATVRAQRGTRLRALGSGPASLQDAGRRPRAALILGARTRGFGSARALFLPSCEVWPRGPKVPHSLGPDCCAGEADRDSFCRP